MMNSNHHNSDRQAEAPQADNLAELFRHVDPREKPPEEDTLAIRAAVHREWQAATQRRRRRYQISMGAIAACLLLAIVINGLWQQQSRSLPALQVLAQSSLLTGEIQLVAANGRVVIPGDKSFSVHAGQTIRTLNGAGLALTWNGGASLRIDENTELQLKSASLVEIVSGRIYLDTSPQGSALPAPHIVTPQGLVMHVGTRYMTESGHYGTRISVREGLISFEPESESDQSTPAEAAEAGLQLSIDRDGEMDKFAIDPWGEQWAWAESLPSEFPAESANLDELFQWVARETGRELIYSTPDARQRALQTRLHGKLSLPPKQALEAATATSDFHAEIVDGELIISLKI